MHKTEFLIGNGMHEIVNPKELRNLGQNTESRFSFFCFCLMEYQPL